MFRVATDNQPVKTLAVQATRATAATLIATFGEAALDEARARARSARARGDRTEGLMWSQIAFRIRRAIADEAPALRA
ncbi:hypothetical protein OPKNFCMD_2430 [Methylobacterium crusticola]|uniref:Uncharacterized protein n=2 Tax=Methylobacterium crusticola TaxID=1697972 RepID=A0ABQ4QWY0_9HYPH|nr:hypothetical protein OPKNFCMD_2430 [Methylobacterium crusticola]